MLDEATIKCLRGNGNWIIRTSNNGKSYKGFTWQPIGAWTKAPDWNPKPVCGGGLHGQNDKAHGYFRISGQRLELCEYKGEAVAIDGNKLKCHIVRIIAVNEDIPLEFLEAIGLKFARKPSLRSLTSMGRGLFIEAKTEASLPALTSMGGGLFIWTKANLPALTSMGGGLFIRAKANLPALTSVGGDLSIRAKANLPALTSVGGYLFIRAEADLPALTSVNGRKGKFINGKFVEARRESNERS